MSAAAGCSGATRRVDSARLSLHKAAAVVLLAVQVGATHHRPGHTLFFPSSGSPAAGNEPAPSAQKADLVSPSRISAAFRAFMQRFAGSRSPEINDEPAETTGGRPTEEPLAAENETSLARPQWASGGASAELASAAAAFNTTLGGFLPRDDTIVRTGEENSSFFFGYDELNESGWFVPRLLYDHMPKADGTYLQDIFRTGAEKKHFVLRREFESLSDTDRRTAFTIGSVRNPCDYYVSLWSYGVEMGGSLLAKVPADQRWVYKTSSKLKDSQRDIHAFRKWVQYINKPGFPGIMSVRFAKSYVKGAEVDAKWPPASLNDTVLSFVEAKLASFDTQDIDCWVHHETLDEDADSCLLKWSYHSKIRPQWVAFSEAKKASYKKSSKHAPCTKYFDNATAEMVKNSEKHIFSLFEYPACCA